MNKIDADGHYKPGSLCECDPVSIAIATTVAAVGSSAVQGAKARKQAKAANAQNLASSEKQAQSQQRQYNAANQKMPDVAALFANNGANANRGVGGTFLTGASGVNPTTLPLGGVSLLGA